MIKTFEMIRRLFSYEENPSPKKEHPKIQRSSPSPSMKEGDYFKDALRQIYACKVPFDVVVVHTKPKTRMGTYSPRSRRIRINDGWGDTHDCMETAIHEYAHHIHYTEKGKTRRKEDPHGKQFWQIYGQLMYLAKQKGLYSHFDAL